MHDGNTEIVCILLEASAPFNVTTRTGFCYTTYDRVLRLLSLTLYLMHHLCSTAAIYDLRQIRSTLLAASLSLLLLPSVSS
jgi:hypothetical protein